MYNEAAGLVANRLYTNIATFSGGLPEWKKANLALDTTKKLTPVSVPEISKEQFKASIGKDCMVDIRTPKTYHLGYFTKYLNAEMQAAPKSYFKKYFHKIPLAYISKKYSKIPTDRKIVIVDHNGKRAGLAARFLKEKGYEDVAILKGGMTSFDR